MRHDRGLQHSRAGRCSAGWRLARVARGPARPVGPPARGGRGPREDARIMIAARAPPTRAREVKSVLGAPP